jgi:hypothetical protein
MIKAMRSVFRNLKLGIMLAVVASLVTVVLAKPPGGKGNGGGGGGGTAANGTVYLSISDPDDFWNSGRDLLGDHGLDLAVDLDGDNPLTLAEVLIGNPNGHASASWLVYGSDPYLDRWRLGIWEQVGGSTPSVTIRDSRVLDGNGDPVWVDSLQFEEIQASRIVEQGDGSQRVQSFEISNTAYELALSRSYASMGVVWDKQDQFISVLGEDISHFTLQVDSQGRPWIDVAEANRKQKLYVFPISGMDIETQYEVDPDSGEWFWPEEKIKLSNAIEVVSIDTASHFDWSPDGNSLVYQESGQLWLVNDLATGTPTHHLIWPNAQGFPVKWSPVPGDNRVVFIGTTAQGSGLCISQIDLDNPSPNAVLAVGDSNKGSGSYAIGGSWLPDGGAILYSTVKQASNGGAYDPGISKFDIARGRASVFMRNALLQEVRLNTSAVQP